ncbi:MAG: hypothetical protein E7120_07465 [Bacteroidales bacterium]|nr:hypothetical protein [Bacteroidales bacterium]
MKRILNTLLISAVAVLAFSCQEEHGLDVAMNESIVLDISSGLTKAADTDVESFVNHLDVIIFDVDGTTPGTKVYSGRYSVNNATSVTLSVKRSSFAANQRFYVYLIANSTLPESDFTAIETYNDLVDKKQEDLNLHLSGLSVDGAPKYFLMDAVAEDTDGASPVVLNNGVYTDNTVLDALLTRAAAKVVVNITASDKVEFKNFTTADGSDGGLYYLRNMPYDTYLLAEAREAEQIRTAKVRNTTKTNNAYFTWNPAEDNKNVSLTTYVYPNNWADNSILEREASVVMNLPMTYTTDEGTVDHKNSWYKIPMTDEKMFKRNNYYEVNITLNRPGAVSESVPVELNDIYYSVIEWTPQDIYVGGDDKPKYLSVNEESMVMHNVAVDATTLEFASSSPVTITVKDIYYYDKFGQKTTISPEITGTTDGGITGNITVSSPIPTNNAIRYFTLVITNEEGLTREVTVTQYPLEYITNQQGWYSYRSDFYTGTYNPTTYEYKGSRRTAANWGNNGWSYGTEYGEGYFFGSKVASMRTDGTSRLYYYRWTQNGTSASTDQGNLTALNNARMYHVQITASSGKYIVGIPKLDADGFTDDGEDNAKLVSPSFMIASQLGATLAPGSKEQAERHCREYVEVYDPDNNPQTNNAIHYDNWRLPTEAEIKIIIDFQYVENAAMDEVLSGSYYWSATGQVHNPGSDDNGTQSAVRCIRDVY